MSEGMSNHLFIISIVQVIIVGKVFLRMHCRSTCTMHYALTRYVAVLWFRVS